MFRTAIALLWTLEGGFYHKLKVRRFRVFEAIVDRKKEKLLFSLCKITHFSVTDEIIASFFLILHRKIDINQ